jgi:hypothetical protein
MNTKSLLLAIPVCLFASMAQADVVNFSSGYGPFAVDGVNIGPSLNGGYASVAQYPGNLGVAYNPNAVSLSSFYLTDPAATFTLNSFVIAGAWGSQTLHFTGYNDGVLSYATDLWVDTVATLLTLDWVGIDQFSITTGSDFVQQANLTGSGQHWALGSLTYNNAVTTTPTIPEPGLLALLGIGLAGLGVSKWRKAA